MAPPGMPIPTPRSGTNSSPLVSYGQPMSHYGGWSYVYRPAYWPASNSFYRCR